MLHGNLKSINEEDLTYFYDTLENIKSKITPMTHSKRFWLSVKFFHTSIPSLSQNKMCELFGIGTRSVKEFYDKHPGKTFTDFNGLAPIETIQNRKRFKNVFKKLALNYEGLF